MKTQILYKVVYRSMMIEQSFISIAWVNPYLVVRYKINETSRPSIGKIFCFDSLEKAEIFSINFTEPFILKGVGTNPTKMKRHCKSYMQINQFWKQKKNKKKITTSTSETLPGTILVDSFTPTEIIKQ